MGKRVLVIAYYWPPSGGSGVQRWVKFCKYLPKEGWEPVVYAPEGADYPALDPTLEREVSCEVIRGRIWEPYAAYKRLMGKEARTEVTEISSGEKNWKQKLSLWIRANLFVPDPRVGWVCPSVKRLKKYLKEHPVDAIVTTGPPHSVHLIGLKLHKALGIPWVPDFRDPWSRMYYLKHLPMTDATWAKLRRQEQAVLDNCSTVLTCTPFVQEEFRAQTATPVTCITNGFDEDDFAGRQLPRRDKHFNITHTGLLAKDGNPIALWKVLGKLASADEAFAKALRLRLVGKVDREVLEAIAAEGLQKNVELLGECDHAAAVREQRAATLLVLPLRNDPQYRPILPGKLFEYLAARRPILGIGQPDGATAQVIASTKAGVMADWNAATAMKKFIADTWKQFSEGGVPATAGDIGPYTRRATTKALAALLDQVQL